MMAHNKCVRLEICRRLCRRVTPLNLELILFTDDKLFTIEQAHNHQNARNWCAEAPGSSAVVEDPKNPKFVMDATGKIPLVFVDEGVKFTKMFTAVTSWMPW